MINSEMVKKAAKEFGADLVGITSMDRFEGSPKQNDPRYIFPQAKAMVVLGYRMPRGAFRGIEEGTFFASYPSMAYAGINWVYGPMVLWNLTRFIEDEGYDTVPIANINGGEAVNVFTGDFKMNWSVPVSPDKPYPDVLVNFRISAFCAGLGEIGYSRIFLTPQFGPMQRFNILLTDAPLEPDPIYDGPAICDRCKLCVKNCPGALSGEKTVKLNVAGRTLEFADMNPSKCLEGIRGNVENGGSPFIQDYPSYYGYGNAVEGAKGCIRACYAHLESKGVLKHKFHDKFRKEKTWSITPGDYKPLSKHVIEDYVNKGKVEECMDQKNAIIEKKETAEVRGQAPTNKKIADPWK